MSFCVKLNKWIVDPTDMLKQPQSAENLSQSQVQKWSRDRHKRIVQKAPVDIMGGQQREASKCRTFTAVRSSIIAK